MYAPDIDTDCDDHIHRLDLLSLLVIVLTLTCSYFLQRAKSLDYERSGSRLGPQGQCMCLCA